jgi:hypothetical protein
MKQGSIAQCCACGRHEAAAELIHEPDGRVVAIKPPEGWWVDAEATEVRLFCSTACFDRDRDAP